LYAKMIWFTLNDEVEAPAYRRKVHIHALYEPAAGDRHQSAVKVKIVSNT
jgi:hypothetical protein